MKNSNQNNPVAQGLDAFLKSRQSSELRTENSLVAKLKAITKQIEENLETTNPLQSGLRAYLKSRRK